MKFTDGYWMNQERYRVESPKEIYEVFETSAGLGAYATYKRIGTRGDTLNVGNTKIEAFSPAADVIGLRLTHFEREDSTPSYDLHFEKNLPLSRKISETEASLSSGDLTLKLPISSKFRISFDYKGQEITASELNAQASIDDLATGSLTSGSVLGMQDFSANSQRPRHYMREMLNLDVDTKIYGTGERFTALVKNGQSIDIVNKDGGTGSEQSYKNIPFYLAAKPGFGEQAGIYYGVFVNESQPVSLEIASENVDRVQFSAEGESLEYYVIAGDSPKAVVGKFNKLMGGGALPPAWTFGLWLSTSFTTDYSEETVMSFIDGMAERDIPLDVFHFDCFWMKGFEWSNFTWDSASFPDPEGMLQRIHDKGVKVCVWINPYIAQKSPLFAEGKAKGYFVKHLDGSVWQTDLWQAGMAYVDFTNPAAVAWYQEKLRTLLKMGADCFKTDFGERIPVQDASYFDGSDPKGAHNFYTYLYNQAVYELLKAEKGEDQAVVFARSATVGSQKFPVHWGGDNVSSYQSMADTLRGGLSFLSSGFNFWSHDIGGFEEETPAALYKRWTQFGLLSSHSRYHGNIQYRVPWNFDEEAVEVTRKFTKLKVSLIPYLYEQADQAVKAGIPLMRPMFMEFPNDPNVFNIDLQYMLGESLLVAPVFNKAGQVRFYLPAGKWTRLVQDSGMSEELTSRGEWFEEKHSFLSLPLFKREGHEVKQDFKIERAGEYKM